MTGQLNLFKGPRQRGTQPPPPKEFASQCFIADLLREFANPQWRWTAMPMGELRDHAINPKTGKRFSPTGQRLQRMGMTPGWPDFMFVGPQRMMFWLELKRRGRGHFSDEQIDIGAFLAACGHAYLATSSVKDAVAELQAFGILPKGLEVQ